MDFDKYPKSFSVMSDEAAETWKTEIWILNEYRSSKNELHFHGYNAKLVPLPEWKRFDASSDWSQKRIKTCKEFTSDFDGLVYMDKVCVSNLDKDERTKNNMEEVVFTDKYFLVKLLYRLLEKPSKVKIQKTLYLLFAFYGATYGRLQDDNKGDNDFSEQNYPENLFSANFEAWKYGPVEIDVYKHLENVSYLEMDLTDDAIDNFFNTIELKNVKLFIENIVNQVNNIDDFTLIYRVREDSSWSNVYSPDASHLSMDNSSIVNEYIEKYV